MEKDESQCCKRNQASSYNEHLIDCLKSVNGRICASCFTYPEYLSALCMIVLNLELVHGNYIGKEILFQIDYTTFICRQRTNKLTDIVSLLVEQN